MSILRPGAHPPIIIGYCGICDQPAERLQFDVVSSVYSMGIHAQCCGKTSSKRISIEEIFRLKRTNEKLYVIVGKRRNQEIRPQARM